MALSKIKDPILPDAHISDMNTKVQRVYAAKPSDPQLSCLSFVSY